MSQYLRSIVFIIIEELFVVLLCDVFYVVVESRTSDVQLLIHVGLLEGHLVEGERVHGSLVSALELGQDGRVSPL